MTAQEKAAGMLVTPATARTNDFVANHTAQKISNPALNGADRARALSALHAIPPDLPHDEWVRVLMAAKSAGPEYEDVDAWSAAGTTYSAQAMRSTWQSIKPDGGIGAGTLFYIAEQHGWHDRINGTAPAKPMQAVPRTSTPPVPCESPDAVLTRCEPATHHQHYIVEKGAHGVPLVDLRVLPAGDPLHIMGEPMAGALVVPVRRADGSLTTLQFIPPPEVAERLNAKRTSGKLNLPGAHLENGWHTVGEMVPGGTIYVCEGIGQSWSCWKAIGAMSVCCFGVGRMRTVATELRKLCPTGALVLVSDRGKEKECAAIASEVGAAVVHMPEGEAQNFDANDYAKREGHDALADLLENARGPDVPESADGVVLTKASDIAIKAVSWLWTHWLALGKLILLAGAPGQGKTTLALAFAATVSSGGRWPDGTCCAPGNVLIWSGEDDLDDTLAPRLKGMGAGMDRIHFVAGSRIDGKVAPFDPARDMPSLLAAGERLGNVRLIVLDPIVSAITGDSHRNAEVRRDLQPLVDLASALGAAVVGITHFSKGTAGRDPTERVTGSIAFSAVARTVLLAAKVKSDDGQDQRILVRSKSNIGPDSGGFEYHIEQVAVQPGVQASVVTWGAAVEGTARELLAEAEGESEGTPDGSGKQSAVDAAADFLRQVLADGPKAAKAVEAEAVEAGVSKASVRRAANVLGIKKANCRDAWYWSLPQGAQVGRDKNVEHLEQVEHLEPKQAQQGSQGAQGEQDAQGVKAGGIEQHGPAPERRHAASGPHRGVEI